MALPLFFSLVLSLLCIIIIRSFIRSFQTPDIDRRCRSEMDSAGKTRHSAFTWMVIQTNHLPIHSCRSGISPTAPSWWRFSPAGRWQGARRRTLSWTMKKYFNLSQGELQRLVQLLQMAATKIKTAGLILKPHASEEAPWADDTTKTHSKLDSNQHCVGFQPLNDWSREHFFYDLLTCNK